MPIDLLQIASYPAWDEEPLARAFRFHRWWELVDRDAFLAAREPTIRAVATDGGKGLDRAVMDRLPALEAISVYGVGVDAVDLPEARRRGIAVDNTPDVLTGSVADLAVGMILAPGTVETRQAMGRLMRDNLSAHFDGRLMPGRVA